MLKVSLAFIIMDKVLSLFFAVKRADSFFAVGVLAADLMYPGNRRMLERIAR